MEIREHDGIGCDIRHSNTMSTTRIPHPRSAERRRRRDNPDPGTLAHTHKMLLWGTLVTLLLSLIPYADYLTWPLRLMVTYIHEGWHALATVLTGGTVRGVEVVPQGSGSTITQGGIGIVISSAGYLGTMFTGTAMLVLLRRGFPARRLLAGLAIAVGLVTSAALGSLFTLAVGIGLTLVLAVASNRLPRAGASFAAGFVGIQCGLNAMYDLKTLFVLSYATDLHTDAMNMQEATMIPAIVWATLWFGMGIAMVWRMLIIPMMRNR